MQLIQCSTIGGATSAHWFKPEDLGGSKRCIRAYKANGDKKKFRYSGDFDWHNLLVNRANIIERGTPELSPGWEARADAAREVIITEAIPA